MAYQPLSTKVDSLIGFIDDNLAASSQSKQKIVICGAGNAAHVFCGLCAAEPSNEVHLLSLFRTEAKDFQTALKKTADQQLTVEVVEKGSQIKSAPYNITNDAKCLQGADIVIISLPAFAHAQYLNACKQNIKSDHKKTLVAIFPGASGVECEWQSIVGKQTNFVLLSCITLPWAARIKTFGQAVEILSTKNKVEVCLYGAQGQETRFIAMMQKIIGEECQLVDYGQILSMSLSAMNAVAHPALMYAKWRNWDGVSLKDKPLFYHGVDQDAGDIMCALSSQVIDIAKCVEQQTGMTLNVPHIFDWFLQAYGTVVGDTSCLHKAMLTNPGYTGLVHPMTEKDDGTFVPNWSYRYLKEDIPFGLIVIRGLSLILEPKYQQQLTPKLELMDKIIVWSQRCLQKEYFVYNDKNEIVEMGKDIQETRAPQRYNITNIKDLM